MQVTETTKVECPSGLVGTVRALRISEILAMQDMKALRQGRVFNQLITSCWVETLHTGPYNFDISRPPPWANMLHCDKIFILRQIRMMTGGPDYEFEMACGHCGHRYVWVQPLQDLKCKPIPPTTLDHVRRNQDFVLEVDTATVSFRSMINSDDERLMRLTQEGRSAMMGGFLCRITGVKLTDGTELSETGEVEGWLMGLDLDSFDAIETAMDDTDGGLELRAEAECPSCRSTETVIVPLLLSISRASIKRSSRIAKAKMDTKANTTANPSTQNPPTENSGQRSSP